MSKEINQGAALVAFMQGKGTAPRFAKVAELGAALTQEALRQEGEGIALEQAYLAAALAVYALESNIDNASPTASWKAFCEAHPMPGNGATPRQRRTTVKAALLTHAERFAPSNKADEKAICAEAIAYAKGVDCRAERDARAEKSKAAREANGDKRGADKADKEASVSVANIADVTAETALTLAMAAIQRLHTLAGEGDTLAADMLATLAKAAKPAKASQRQDKAA